MVFLAQTPKELLLVQLENAFILMILGMATVFVFLTLLVILTKGMSALVTKYSPDKKQSVVTSPSAATVTAATVPAGTANEAEVATAIVAAFAKSKE